MSYLPTILLFALAVVCCSGHLVRDSKDLMKRRHCTFLGCHSSIPSQKRLVRSLPEEEPDTKIIYSDLPTDRMLQEVKSQYVSSNEEVEIIRDENQEVDGNRHKRGVRAVVFRICHRRTGQCRIIIVYRRF
ncbi:uncharacterized protein [Halyomorpha halys]|uniref:uncharacterized protein n=1 Tax=Halyomorpha halys TaxID=286706 RepID=UPI0034D32FBF